MSRPILEKFVTDYKSARAVIWAMPVKPEALMVTEDVWRKIYAKAVVVRRQRGEDSPVEIRMRWGGITRVMIIDGVKIQIQGPHYRINAPEN